MLSEERKILLSFLAALDKILLFAHCVFATENRYILNDSVDKYIVKHILVVLDSTKFSFPQFSWYLPILWAPL